MNLTALTSSALGLLLAEWLQQSYMVSTMLGKEGSAFPSLSNGRSPLLMALLISLVDARFSNGRCPVNSSKRSMAYEKMSTYEYTKEKTKR